MNTSKTVNSAIILPSVGMMIFTSLYRVVDGFFVSNFADKTPFAAVHLIMPLINIFATVGFIFFASPASE